MFGLMSDGLLHLWWNSIQKLVCLLTICLCGVSSILSRPGELTYNKWYIQTNIEFLKFLSDSLRS